VTYYDVRFYMYARTEIATAIGGAASYVLSGIWAENRQVNG
jgi:hypothetical protein